MPQTTASFPQAAAEWHLDTLYRDLAIAKHQLTGKAKPLTPLEISCLQGLLCGYGPNELAVELKREPRGLRVDLSRGLYRYVEVLTERSLNTLKDWREVAEWLTKAGYRIMQPTTTAMPNHSQIRIVDVALEGTAAKPIIDLKVRNIGNQVAFLKAANFQFHHVWTLNSWIIPVLEDSMFDVALAAPCAAPEMVRSRSRQVNPSYNYNVSLPSEARLKPGLTHTPQHSEGGQPIQTETVKVSQCVDCNDVDRFTFTLAAPSGQLFVNHRAPELILYTALVYHFHLELVYNEDNQQICSDDIVLLLDPNWAESDRQYVANAWDAAELQSFSRSNEQAIAAINQINGIKSPNLPCPESLK
ncbi:hypothetical protein ACN4EK_13525 [Pantanalinema rosaneae CENA516]|uniref:hypothetical protein n=1 Tax=Pantanalinema rosaneae TaxID=1620701 RepID=UPI003D6E52C7